VVKVLRNAGADVLGIVSIFTYGMKKGLDNLAKANIQNISLTNLDVLVQIAVKEGFIKENDIEKLLKFRDNPNDESWQR
jgi:orotate phosphoribosyltransferase